MTKRSHLEIEQLEKVRFWIRENRRMRGWSARKLSEEAKLAAKRRGKLANVSQQSISSFEAGHNKSIPAWISLLVDAFEDTPPSIPIPEISQQPFPIEKPCTKKIPPETDLRKILLGLLAPMEVNLHDAWSLKQQIATSLAKRLPVAITQPQLYADI
ncbi:MAG: XRE family transcriptional regulator [Zymomonas mobilis]|uniref:XRE family transcriptional regulator n=1 Tax=Zymomonas mobilis TaxID=542 RepID=UPI0039EB792F